MEIKQIPLSVKYGQPIRRRRWEMGLEGSFRSGRREAPIKPAFPSRVETDSRSGSRQKRRMRERRSSPSRKIAPARTICSGRKMVVRLSSPMASQREKSSRAVPAAGHPERSAGKTVRPSITPRLSAICWARMLSGNALAAFSVIRQSADVEAYRSQQPQTFAQDAGYGCVLKREVCGADQHAVL